MKIFNVSDRDLRRALRETEAALGPDAKSVAVLRRELARRRRTTRRSAQSGLTDLHRAQHSNRSHRAQRATDGGAR